MTCGRKVAVHLLRRASLSEFTHFVDYSVAVVQYSKMFPMLIVLAVTAVGEVFYSSFLLLSAAD